MNHVAWSMHSEASDARIMLQHDSRACGHVPEGTHRGTKTMSCFHTQKWSRVKALAQWFDARPVLRWTGFLARQGSGLNICAEEVGAFQCNVVERQCNM